MTNELERLVLSTATIPENGHVYHLEIRHTGTDYISFVMHGSNQLFVERHNTIGNALGVFYKNYAHPSAQEKLHGP